MDVVKNKDVVEKTWAEVGYKVRPLARRVFVKTDAPPEKIGMIFMPPKEAHFFGGLGHLRLVTATVLSVGPQAKLVNVGDRVCFQRLHFGHIVKLAQGVFVGWVDETQLCGYPELDTDVVALNA